MTLMNINEIISVANRNSLAQKWNIVSTIWHKSSEIDYLIDELGINQSCNLIDVACGNGFHVLELLKRGYHIDALDGDEGNIKILDYTAKELCLEVSAICGKWQNLPITLKPYYDKILCLGTSITYFESWDENITIKRDGMEDRLKDVIRKFKNIMCKDGQLVLGIADYYKWPSDQVTIQFDPKIIGGNTYKMTWQLDLDWKCGLKHFNCTIENNSNVESHIHLVSYLFDHAFLADICTSLFNDVKTINQPSNLKDILIVCS